MMMHVLECLVIIAMDDNENSLMNVSLDGDTMVPLGDA